MRPKGTEGQPDQLANEFYIVSVSHMKEFCNTNEIQASTDDGENYTIILKWLLKIAIDNSLKISQY